MLKAKNNVVADTLSRENNHGSEAAVNKAKIIPALDLEALILLQNTDSDLTDMINSTTRRPSSKYTLKHMTFLNCPEIIWCETSGSAPRPYVPEQLRRNVLIPSTKFPILVYE